MDYVNRMDCLGIRVSRVKVCARSATDFHHLATDSYFQSRRTANVIDGAEKCLCGLHSNKESQKDCGNGVTCVVFDSRKLEI